MESYEGKRLDGRYEIHEIIGVGGMAVVYKAYDNIDDRVVAVKILKNEFLANEEFRRRFKNESKAIAVLSHPNIVKVYDVSYGDRLQYIVMEYVEGITLKEYIQQQGRLSHREAVFFVMQILRALQHAHDKGIVHRDIKPQNVMLLENGAIKVTDFGIARFITSETRTMTDSAIGSVHYISPEQARGDIIDDKADIYSVGVMLYEMLTGKLPFESDNTVSVALMQLQQEPVKPREINSEIPIGLEQIVLKAMQKNVHDRYQSAAEMLLDLEEFKRNPSIKFDYTYDNTEPTKYIPVVKTNKGGSNKKSSDEDNEPVTKNRTIPILVGIILALIIVIGSVFGILYGKGYFTGNVKVKVPDFKGQIYSEESFKEKYPDFTFEITEKVDSSVSPDSVISQDPEAGTKIVPSKVVINLVIATDSELIEIPTGLIGEDYVSVVTQLTQAGFVVDEKEAKSEDYPDIPSGTVISISPSESTKVSVGSTVTVEYVSYDGNVEKLVPVPDVSGLTETGAKQALTSLGFTVKVSAEYNDTVKNGYVVSNTFAGSKIPYGSSVTVTLSKGPKIEQTALVEITLPNSDDYSLVTATLDAEEVFSQSLHLNGENYTFEVNGSEATSVFRVFADGNIIFKCNINFTATPVQITNQSYFDMPTVAVLNVLGLPEDEAISLLYDSGFENVTVNYATTSDESSKGKVIKQSPNYGVKASNDAEIVITIG